MSSLHKVFVYGTLKRGEPNHHWFNKNGFYKFICTAKTQEKYPLIIGTKYNIPFLLDHPGDGANVEGEVYEVDDIVFANLDELEDHPNFYVREQIIVTSLENSVESHNVWTYFIKKFNSNLLNQTKYESYSNMGSHGLKYVSSEVEESSLDDLNSPN